FKDQSAFAAVEDYFIKSPFLCQALFSKSFSCSADFSHQRKLLYHSQFRLSMFFFRNIRRKLL
ncbi:MAG: hypothetical protein Q4C06_01865, partial [Bacillota bacterium]|nr:hypothetical protein [Bacillota bacterium]